MYPNYYSFWGGGIEFGETPEAAMLREMREELAYVPKGYECLGTFLTPGAVKTVFYGRVEKQIIDALKVYEGQCGVWLDEETLLQQPNIILQDKCIIKNVMRKIMDEDRRGFGAAA